MTFVRFTKYWMPVFIWLGVIFIGSTDALSAEQTSRFLVPFLRWLDPQISFATIAAIHFALRKLGHLTEYAIFAALLWRALRRGTRLQAKMSILFLLAWFAAAIFAVFDEFHQSFVPSRTASPIDMMIDIFGAMIGLIICMMFAAQGRFGPLNQETRKPQKER
jgi:VanZ family protein